MKIIELLKDLKENSINISEKDGDLDIVVNDDNLSDELLKHISNNKEQLLGYLKNRKIKDPSDFTYKGLKTKEYKIILINNQVDGANVADIYNLTPLQEGFLFHSMMDKESSTYFEQISLDLKGNLDVSLVERGWQKVVDRHDPLRTMFISDSSIPLQVVLKYRDIDFLYKNISEEDDLEKSIDKIKRTDRKETFNLKTDPLFRIKLIKSRENQFTLILSFHHIILDGWCMPLLISEFIENYGKLSNNEEISIDFPPRYSEYISWLNNRDKDSARKFWDSYLDGYEELATVPKDTQVEYKGKEEQLNYSFSVSKDQTGSLRKIADEIGVTLNTIIQAIWGVVLSTYNGADDVIFGSTVSGRPQEIERIEKMVGLFINTIPVRIRTDRDKSFRDVAIDVQRSALETLDYHYSSLGEIQGNCGLGNGLLDHIMVFENYPIDEAFKDNNTSLLEIGNVESFEQINYDLGIIVFPTEQLGFKFSYNPEKYSEESLERVSSHIKKAISEIILNDEIVISEIDIIPEKEKNLLLNVFNDTNAEYPKEKTIVDLFEEQVEKTPNNIAVIFEDIQLTYRELNDKANIVGHYLRDNFNIEPDDLLGVMLNRTDKLFISLLGVLKSGAAYIPIDPGYPEERINYMLYDSNPKIVISEKEGDLFIDINKILEVDKNLDNLQKISNADNLAYVIYTSGTTGKPKGTLLSNNAVVNYLKGITEKIDFRPDKTIISVTTFSFDIFVTESFLPLSIGLKIVLANDEQQADPYALKELIKTNHVNMIQSTPSRIKMLTSEDSLLDVLSSLTEIMIGGEPFPDDLLKILNNSCKGKIYNMYGPTETTVWSTLALLDNERSVNIGKPIANTQIYILDTAKKLLPYGVPGELYISGEGIARGYLNRPNLTSEKFVDNPFLTGERMYRTGDLARWLPEGNIEFLGRIDNQVKIRGFRIELGEIENALLQYKHIDTTVVCAKETTDGDKQLVAYYVSEKELEVSKLRCFLSKTIPDYMIPSFFIYMDSLPLTPNGKVDRKAFPELDGVLNTSIEYFAPRNRTEKILVDIWQDILDVDRIGILDNFYTHGGHSLKATRVISRIGRDLEVEISLKDLFANPTIASLYEIISQSNKTEYKQIEIVSEQDYYDLSNAQRRLWVLDQFEKDSIAYNMPAAFILEGKLKTDAFKQAYSFMIGRHESLRTVFITENGNPKQKILKATDFDIEILDLRNGSDVEKEAEILVEKDFQTSFNLEEGPLVRFTFIRLEDEKYLLLFNMHHIISDGWSMDIFVKEFLASYESFREGQTPELAPLRIHYKDYSAWQNDLMKSSEIDSQKEYWLDKLSGDLPVLDLPSDNTRPVTQTYNGNSIGFVLPKEINSSLNDLCLENNASLFMMLQALVKVLFHRYTGQTDIILGSPIAGRIHEDLENQIGFYVNTLSLRDTIEGDLTFNEFLGIVKNTCTDAFNNQDYPFDALVDELDITRDLSRSPLFDVMVTLQNNEREAVELDGLKLTPYGTNSIKSKYDIVFYFLEMDEGVSYDIEYNTDIYNEDRIIRMAEHFKILVSSIIKNPELRIKDLDIIPDDEKNLLLNVFNDSKTDYPSDKTIVDLFEEQVDKTPDNIAVVFENVELTYRELNEKANNVGHYLKDNYAIEPDDLIGVFVDRSYKSIIVLLGILKSGAGYVPIDPEYPENRINYMVEDSCCCALISQKSLQLSFSDINTKTIFFDDIEQGIGLDKKYNLKLDIKPDNLMYIIYTSGSTGNPKGVMIEHRNIVNLAISQIRKFGITEDEHILQFSSLCFDASVEQINISLLSGATLFLITKDILLDEDLFSDFIIDNRLTHIHAVPTFIKTIKNRNYPSLKRIIAGGDVCPVELARKWTSTCTVYNEYGPTETAVTSTEREFLNSADIGDHIDIGKPISNTQIFIVDEYNNIQPVGIPGEMCIAGAGVARGYLNDDELTKLKFIDNPFGEGFLYKTGDLAKLLPDGNIDFLGRIDNQVKINGFRIECTEIENSLRSFNNEKNNYLKQCKEFFTSGDLGNVKRCKKCLISGNFPGAKINENGICSFCDEFEEYKEEANLYFKGIPALEEIIKRVKEEDIEYDCMLLFSGGKDSSYVLYRLVELGLKVLAFTFDNGYISDTAFSNIKRITSKLGVDSLICNNNNMNQIFVESLHLDHTVCGGCFQALTTVSTKVAIDKGIKMVFTGLSRGQIFDTKLHGLFTQEIYDIDVIEEKLLDFRKLYHSKNDKINYLLNIELNNNDLNSINFIDFFRYENIKVDEIKEYLQKKDEYWTQPGDTGFCSTNCTINDVGIYFHSNELSYHNYEGPLSWDIRLGVSKRDEIIDEVLYYPDFDKTLQIANEIGYSNPKISDAIVIDRGDNNGNRYLCAYFTGDEKISVKKIRKYLSKYLPDYMIPAFFVYMDVFPLTSNGKIDIKALPEADGSVRAGINYVAPRNEIEEILVSIWQEVLGIEKVGILDNFFELGGHSLKATRVVSQIIKELEVDIALRDIFESQTVETLFSVIVNARRKGYKQIDVVPECEYYDVSNAQKRLWVLDQFVESSIAYNLPAAFILEGELRPDFFKQAYSFLVERHESLRTVFITENGEPRQKILKNFDLNIEIKDFRNSLDPEKEARVLAEKDLHTSFNLDEGPLVRFNIIQIEDEKFLLLFNMHHIISDGWSLNIFTKEFLASYESFKEGNTPELVPLRIHYKDYSAWMNNLLKSPEMENQREYWLDKLSGELSVLNVPADNVRPVIQTFNGSNIDFSLTKKINSGLNELCLKNKVSLFMMLQALVKVLFHRYTGQEDIILGSPIAGRVHEDLENQIGFYVNTLSLRDIIEGDLTFNEFLAGVKKTCTDAFDNQDYPFDSLVEELDIKRDMSRSPLFDVMLVLENNETAAIEFDGLNISPYKSENIISKFDMTFNFAEINGCLFCNIEYNSDIYGKDRIIRMIEHFKTLISSVLESPELRIKDLEIIGDEEKNLLLNVFNDTKTDCSNSKSIVDMFEEQVEKFPDNIAVVFEDVKLTYSELNGKANKVAHYLIDNYDIKPNDLVGVLLDRSEKMIIAIFGVLKSGAAYLPIDTENPQDRIDYILEDSKVKVVIAENNNGININITDVLSSSHDTKNLLLKLDINFTFYVIYTSGTTGKPKGSIINHSNYLNYITWAIDYCFESHEIGNFGLFTSLSFDLTTTSIFLSLLRGKILEVFRQKEDIGTVLTRIFESDIIDSIKLTPSHISILSYLGIQKSNIQLAIVGGEELLNNQVKILKEINTDIKIINEYGPTETTVGCIVKEIEDPKEHILIGKPISNTEIYLMRGNNIVPIDVPGEICICGKGVGVGYLSRPDLSAEKFVENPYFPGKKMYRTGDLARWLPDGNMEFLGRIDNQEKIRGFRIELGEIENTLAEHNNISSTVVLIKKGIDDEKQLIAYIESENDFDISELRNFLCKTLPEYMIPSYFIHMESMPLTPNGKIDRKALPEPDGSISGVIEYAAPRNDIEEKLVEIWHEFLGVEQIGIHNNFFDLGGHSLKATRVISRISMELEVDVSLKEIFENPTIETLSEVINGTKKVEFRHIEVILSQYSYSVSNAQKRLWVLDQFDEESIAYNMPASFIINGELNIEAFKQAYSFMLDRHESLRTVFVTENGEPRQKILENPEYNIEIVDLRESLDRENEARILADNDFLTTFNLEAGTLVRFTIVRMEDERNLLLFNMHHIISDGWSMNIFISEFLGCYNCIKDGKTPDLKPLRIHYKDYSAWQNSLLESDDINNQREYWLDKLSREIPVLVLPSDKIRPVVQTFNGNSLGFSLPKETILSLNELCRENRVSLFMMLQALIKVLFHRYTGQTDIILGSPIAGRTHEDLENQIGFYVNTLIYRDTITGGSSFKEILGSVGKTCTEAFDNQEYPFDRLVEELDIKRDMSRSPLFDVMVVLQNNESTSAGFDGLEILPYNTGNIVSKFDMTFNFTESKDSLFCGIEYNTDIYAEDRIIRMIEHLKTLISSVIRNSETKLKDLEIIGGQEKNLLLSVFNDSKVDYPADKTIIDLFEEQVVKTPDNIAVVFGDVELTYRELNGKANMVGNYLRDNYGLEPNELVAVMLGRSEKMIITLLGILKSGAAYVPIDPEYPVDRITYMLEDSNPKVVISEKKENFNNSKKVIDINEIIGLEISTSNLSKIINSDSLVYVIYTSGSTGKPKGSGIRHRNFYNLLKWYTTDHTQEEDGNFLLVTSFSFDLTQKNFYAPLIAGNSLIISATKGFNPVTIIDEISGHGIRNINCTPGMFYAILEACESDKYDKLSTLGNVYLGGESIDFFKVEKWRRSGNCNGGIINTYGPTECTDICLSHKIDWEKDKILIPLGSPISNNKISIVDGNNELVPIGIPGELCISGAGLGAGYINLPDLSSEKFIESPHFSGEMLYRTGDLARWLPDGNIEFLGRIDNQVKIRGFRIEPGEIENVLHQYDIIDSSVVIAKERIDGDKQLVVYYVSDKEIDISEFRTILVKSIPDYMIPSYFIHMDSFPLTSNGKIDRKALPEPDGTFNTGFEYVSPRNRTEEIVADIWQKILVVDKVGILDNFFELGGHSLKATRVVSMICREFEVGISLKDIFANPTIESLSKIIDLSSRNEFKQIEPVPIRDSYELSNGQRRLWILDQMEEDSTVYNIPTAFYLDGEFCEESFRKAYSFLIERHESLRTVFITEDGEPRQKILQNPETAVNILDIREIEKKEVKVREIAEKEVLTSFNLKGELLIRFTILRLEDEKYLLLFNMHHIISDGWSINILTREFLGAYNNFRVNLIPGLEPLRIHYKDYSAWQNDFLDSCEMENQRNYWQEKLTGEIPILNLPSDKIRPVIQTYNGSNVDFALSKEKTSELNNLCGDYNVSLFIMLHTLVKILFHRYTGEDDIILGSPISGRYHEDLEDQIGFYVNTLVFRDTIADDSGFDQLLDNVKQTCIEAFDNQDYPFDKLVEDLDIKRDISRSPLFDVMLVLQNNGTTNIDFDGITVSSYVTENHISKYDITFSFSESENILSCGIEYNTDIYLVQRIERMVEHFITLVSSVISSPQTKINDLEIIPEEEKNLLLNVFNDTKTDYLENKTIVELFEEQVEKSPDNIAVVFEDVELTYKELNRNANVVGHYLRENYNIKPDDLVGVMLGRSDKMIIALLGILKSGAAYVPIDSEYPADRINFMLEDSNPKIVLSDKNDGLFLDINIIQDNDLTINNLSRISKPDNLAYVIYTSGSTGKPKGTLIEQKSVIRLIRNTNYISIDSKDRIYQTGSLSFDASTFEIWGSLLNGAGLYISKDILDYSNFSKDLERYKISILWLTARLFDQIVSVDISSFKPLKKLLIGGDKLSYQHVNEVKTLYPELVVINGYGPTENTTFTCCFNINKLYKSAIPIGRPVSNTQVYILDSNNNPTPVGVAGELCASGSGLARGYLNRQELTSKKFVDNPFISGERMYRTGDFARWQSDGNIEFIGRRDNQLKIRGFRIEIGEIENVLLQYNNIDETTILLNEDSAGEKKLVAYYVSDDELDVFELIRFLDKSLPDYMVPSYFIHIESFPLTPNGKIDKKSLPEPDGTFSTGVEYVAPRNEIEVKLVEIWQEALGLEKIGIHDNFFDLGGHSLIAAGVISKITKRFSVIIQLRDFFEEPKISYLGKLISAHSLASDIENSTWEMIGIVAETEKGSI